MSYRPHGLAFFLPTGGSLPLAFTVYQAYSPKSSLLLPCDQRVVVPARQQYSHSASDGRRITSSSLSSLRLRSSSVALRQNSTASVQFTRSTALRGPLYSLG